VRWELLNVSGAPMGCTAMAPAEKRPAESYIYLREQPTDLSAHSKHLPRLLGDKRTPSHGPTTTPSPPRSPASRSNRPATGTTSAQNASSHSHPQSRKTRVDQGLEIRQGAVGAPDPWRAGCGLGQRRTDPEGHRSGRRQYGMGETRRRAFLEDLGGTGRNIGGTGGIGGITPARTATVTRYRRFDHHQQE
jgi:hypothetical protein